MQSTPKIKIPMEETSLITGVDQWPIVHASMKPSNCLDFYGTDTELTFNSNIQQFLNWRYLDKKITYKFNSLGLRMDKEVSELSKDYFVAFGCSHTLGVGVAYEDTWASQLSRLTGLDFINSAVSGSSIKLNAINFFNLLEKGLLPRAVAFAWPSSVRYCFYEKDEFLFYLPRFISEESKFRHYSDAYKKLIMTDFNINEAIIYRNMIKTTCKLLDIKFAELSFDATDNFIKSNNITSIDPIVKMELNDYHARDIRRLSNNKLFSHIGSGIHLLAAEHILAQWS
jgi:hypothetical protein